MPRHRRRARTLALQVLYEVDCTSHGREQILGRALGQHDLEGDSREMVSELVHGVTRRREHIDGIIHRHAPAFPVDQLSPVDRNILRIAVFEILMNNRTPPKAAINEAVEISKTFGGENIHRFINGVLGSVMDEVEAGHHTPASRG